MVRRSALTQVIQDPRAPEVVVGDLHLDPEGRVAARGDQPLPLTAVEFDLLLALAKTAGRVRTRSNC